MKTSEWFCKKKKKYLKGQAFSIAAKRNLHNGTNGTAYECEHCGWWHVTKKPRRQIQKTEQFESQRNEEEKQS
jgi:hypothetical protein